MKWQPTPVFLGNPMDRRSLVGYCPWGFLRNLYEGQDETEPDMEHLTGSKLGKEYDKAVCCHLVYLTSMQST